ncbi:ABC transporter substrate-binding protein [Actinoplanes sp. NPDC051411]|uniref:ABC transporter substrate-binding protein n=1 Tax=Actinoplanes sp. NPDC051411 TaxID=3155522 RepID=UPI00341A7C5B
MLTFPDQEFAQEPNIAEHVWSKISDPARTTNPNPVGTGPYTVKSFSAQSCTGPQTDVAVRQAISYAINRDQLNKPAGGGFAVPASPTMLLPGRDDKWVANPGDLKAPGGPDAAKANRILDAAGWTRGPTASAPRAKLLMRLERPTAGTIALSGASDYRRAVQMVFQDPFASLNPDHTVGHHLARPVRLHHRGLSARGSSRSSNGYG